LSLRVERSDPASFGLPREALEGWLQSVGPVAFVDLETTGPPESRSAEIVEIGILLLDPGDPSVGVAQTLLRPSRPLPPLVTRRTRLRDADLRDAPLLSDVRAAAGALLEGRLLIAHEIGVERAFLRRDIAPSLGSSRSLDTREIFSLTHPDAEDLRLETFTRRLLGREERHRALEGALDVACVVGVLAQGARAGEARYRTARRILEDHLPSSPWRALLDGAAASPLAPADFVDFARSRAAAVSPSRSAREVGEDEGTGDARFLQIGESTETPVPFELEAIVEALSDAERGRRHFRGFRVREEQLELARDFYHLLNEGGIAKLEGGTGVGKSLAYLSAAIPFVLSGTDSGEPGDPGAKERIREPIVISTRTKLLQDQLLRKDIAAAARFLGYPQLRALSIKGRANYVCERRLSAALAEARDPALLEELRMDYAMLEACARIRPHGEIGTVPAALLQRHPRLRELLRASVAARAEQCSREQCAHERRCPFGRHRKSLAKAQLIVANHDLLLRWPPDYPSFSHVIVDEGHELGGVAEEVYALRVRPEEVAERLDELFGAPARRGQRRYASRGLVAAPDAKSDEATLRQNRRDLMLELIGLGRAAADRADAFGGVELPAEATLRMPDAADLARGAARRLDALADWALRAGPARRQVPGGEDADGLPTKPHRDIEAEEEAERVIAGHVEALRGAAHGLRTGFGPDNEEFVAAFEGLESPFDRWSLVLRPVAPGDAFGSEFLESVEALAIVSATLFVAGDAHAALGEIGLGDDSIPGSWSHAVGSPFPYDQAMRVVAIDAGAELVEETAQTLAVVTRTLRGRTLGLFTSLARMRAVADRLVELLEGEGIEVLLPRRASDDPGALVERFQKARGGAVLLGARRFWQGIDVRGEDLQAVVIEKLPFEVPTELRRRRDDRLRQMGENPFVRSALGRMLLHLKQMCGRLIRSETDRGLVVIVDARRDRGYFERLGEALPEGTKIEIARREALPGIAAELDLGPDSGALGPHSNAAAIDDF
jgi:ATP-dependent DNA helicase DinG